VNNQIREWILIVPTPRGLLVPVQTGLRSVSLGFLIILNNLPKFMGHNRARLIVTPMPNESSLLVSKPLCRPLPHWLWVCPCDLSWLVRYQPLWHRGPTSAHALGLALLELSWNHYVRTLSCLSSLRMKDHMVAGHVVHICNPSHEGGLGKRIVVWGWPGQKAQNPT
jgi:hypothetical protein